jgi:hypothetical protein
MFDDTGALDLTSQQHGRSRKSLPATPLHNHGYLRTTTSGSRTYTGKSSDEESDHTQLRGIV